MTSQSHQCSSWTIDGDAATNLDRIIQQRRCQQKPCHDSSASCCDDDKHSLQLVNIREEYFSTCNHPQAALLSSLADFYWTNVTWMDSEGLLHDMFQFHRTKHLTLYRVTPPPTSTITVQELCLDSSEQDDENNEKPNDNPQPGGSHNISASPPRVAPCSLMQVLVLEHCVLDTMAAMYLCTMLESTSASANLVAMSFKSCFWWDQDVCIEHLARGLSRYHHDDDNTGNNNMALQQISFHWSNILDHQLALLISSLPSSVDTLDLAGNLCRIQGMTAVAEHWLSSADTRRRKSLLRLREQCVDIGSKLDIQPLLRTSAICDSLIHLDASVNRLTDEDMLLLSKALTRSSKDGSSRCPHGSLEILDVRSNEVTDKGVEALCQIPSLRQLWLQDNDGITQVGAKHLCGAARTFANLEYVGLSERFEEESVSADLEYYTALNWGGRRLLVKNPSTSSLAKTKNCNSVPLGLWPLVLERASKQDGMDRVANILYYLLRSGPILWAI